MARTYPRTLLADDVESEGEVKVFHALRDGLSDGWVVFHSVSWVRRDPGRGAEDGEIDFVLAHPDEGIVCLEVKGGDIECRHGEWQRRLGGAPTRVKDPFAQALDHRYALQRLIDDVPGRRGRDLLIVHAVALPDVPVHSLVLAPDAPRELVVDRRDLEDVGAAVDRVLAYHRGARETRRPRLPTGGARPGGADPRAVDAARPHGPHPRMAIYGCAGSGKTMLAVEHAKRLAAAGRCGPDDVDPADVVVLSSHGPQRSAVVRELDGRLATDAGKRRGDQVVFSSIRAFKGLESPVVVLCELEDLDAETMDQQLYVALSRARNHAIVVAPSPPGP